jgi:uncharacterized protein YbjT (DUF2867 family)/uncharacterized membrane protein YphA (DoxX/SURF4 family)
VRVLILGASGFLGSALAEALHEAGHTLVLTARQCQTLGQRWPGSRCIAVDFARATAAQDWLEHLAGIDAVVNAVGILRESHGQRFESLHVRAPCALFQACVTAGVKRVIQISALGADAEAVSAYHVSKRRADDFLLSLPLRATVVQPSLVFAIGGASAESFALLASMPLIPLIGSGEQRIQPIRRDDLCAAVRRCLETEDCPRRLAAVGQRCVSVKEYLTVLRRSLQLNEPRFLRLPVELARLAAAIGDRTRVGLLDSETLAMLLRGNCADARPLAALLGREPHGPESFVPPEHAAALRREVRLRLALPPLRIAIAVMWIFTGIVSAGIYPVAESLELLARTGLHGNIALVALYAAAALDIALGIAMLIPYLRRVAYLAQIALIVFYTIVITFALPEFWLHPYGPVLKNLPLLAAIALLWALEPRHGLRGR